MPNDDTGLTTKVNVEPLNDTNWETWSFLMEQYLTVNNLWDIVDGTETEPTDATAKAEFLRKQKAARARIALHVSPSQLNSVRLQADPKNIWNELKCLNRPEGFGTRMALRREFAKMKKQPDIPMSKWITSVRDVARQIKDLNGDVPDEEIIVILTNSLPESYKPLVVQLDAMEESARTLSGVITRLIGEERHQVGEKGADQQVDEPLALSAMKKKRKDRSEITCFGCGVKGHYRSECPAANANKPAAPAPGKPPGGPLY
jgi:hypothetical protein